MGGRKLALHGHQTHAPDLVAETANHRDAVAAPPKKRQSQALLLGNRKRETASPVRILTMPTAAELTVVNDPSAIRRAAVNSGPAESLVPGRMRKRRGTLACVGTWSFCTTFPGMSLAGPDPFGSAKILSLIDSASVATAAATFWANSAGTSPVSCVCSRKRVRSDEIFASETGTVPVMRLCPKRKCCSLVNLFPNSVGMRPIKSFDLGVQVKNNFSG